VSYRRHFKFLFNFATIVSVQISAVLISFNEENNIAAAIDSVGWADEILLIDSGSTDRTREIAESVGAKVIVRPWPGFSAQKQFGADSAIHDWIFSLDADERVSPQLAGSIAQIKNVPALADGFKVSRLAFYMGRPIRHGGWYPDRQLRLFDRRKGKWSGAVVHESVKMSHDSIIRTLAGDIHHFTVDSVLAHHKMIGERYAPLGADLMIASVRRTSPLVAAFSGLAAFVRSYFFKLGLLDGFPGFCIAWFGAHNAFLKHSIVLEAQRAAISSEKSPN